jgi:site-specific recombinase XerD
VRAKTMIKKFEQQLVFDGLSKNTIMQYVNTIKLINTKFNVDINNLKDENIKDLVIKFRDTLSKSSCNAYIAVLRKWRDFTGQEYKLPKFVNPETEIPDYFLEDYFLDEIVPSIKKIFDKEIKIKAILYLLFYSGLRVGELCNLNKEDFNLKECSIKIQKRKAKNPIVIYYPKELNDILELHFNNNPLENKAFNIEPYSVGYYCRVLSKNLNRKIHPHLFRHSFAVMFLKKGGDLSTLKELLGHRNINSTLVYSKMSKDDIEKEYRKYIKIKRRPSSK